MSTKLYIGKIGSIAPYELLNVCSQFGTVVDFLQKENYAFVQYATDKEAQAALIELDGRSINGQRIIAEAALAKEVDQHNFETHPRIYVGRLPSNVKKISLLELFGRFGQVSDVMIKDNYAFLEYTNSKDAMVAIIELNGFAIGDCKIVVEEAKPKEPDEITLVKHPRLFVGKLNESVKKQDLVNAFSIYGQIVDILMKDDFAFIEFLTLQSATRALHDMNGAKICGSKITVEEARPREGEILAKNFLNHPEVALMKTNESNLTERERRTNRRRRRSPRRSVSRSRSRSHGKVK